MSGIQSSITRVRVTVKPYLMILVTNLGTCIVYLQI